MAKIRKIFQKNRKAIRRSCRINQEIINIHNYDFMITSNGCEFFLNVLTPEIFRIEHLESMEQLFFAFMMKKKHNKIWDGEDWVENQKSN